MKVEIQNGKVQIDVMELVEAMSVEDRRRVARTLCADEYLVKAVLEMVGSPERFANYFSDDEDGQWWFDSSAALEMREKLVPMLPEVARQAVLEALRQRDDAKADKERESRWAWKLFHAWPGDCWSRPALPDWKPLRRDEDALAQEAAALLSPEAKP